MEYVQSIRSSAADIFLTLPMLLMGLIFFLGTMTSNIGMLYLFLGHLILASSLSWLANEPGPMWFDGAEFSVAKSLKWIFSVFLTLGIQARALGGADNYWIIILALVPFVGQFMNKKPVLWFFNPVAWFTDPPESSATGACAMIPGADKDEKWSTPSAWLVHMAFFFGFLFANANAILNEPEPRLADAPDTPDLAERTAKLEKRVKNRKTLATTVIAVAAFVAILLLFFRFGKTPCESGFFYTLIPIVLIGLTGSAWFQIIYKDCGVRPADVLGIVPNMIGPNMADNPIVCVGA
jgi:hypothetical protein